MNRESAHRGAHGHMWIVGGLGLAAGLVLLLYVPTLRAVSNVLILFAGFHLVGAIVVLSSIYVMTGGSAARWITREAGSRQFDFGWAPGWMLGPWIAALVAAAGAIALAVSAPGWWPFSFGLTLLAAAFFAGGLIARSSAGHDHAVLPMVDLVPAADALMLDAGCGAGRTTIALGRGLKHGRIVALDRFDADYIEGGGQALIARNLALAGMTDRVRVERGDLTAMPFGDATFDGAVSAHAVDHLGDRKEQGLREVLRVLKPGGRFLLVVWVPSWTMFAVGNVLSMFLTSKTEWRRMARSAGFELADEGVFNGIWFALLTKPRSFAQS